MKPLVWDLARFNHIFSYPSDAGDGAETYAQDMVNLRVDRWGHLRLRPVIRALQMHEAGDIAPEDLAITGVAASARQLYWLRSDGQLFVADDIPADPLRIRYCDDADEVDAAVFDFTMERDFIVFRGGQSVSATIGWRQGVPEIADFGIDDIEILFYSDDSRTNQIASDDANFNIGDQTLDEIITLDNFIDNNDGTGSVDVTIDPGGITAMELMANRSVYFSLRVCQ